MDHTSQSWDGSFPCGAVMRNSWKLCGGEWHEPLSTRKDRGATYRTDQGSCGEWVTLGRPTARFLKWFRQEIMTAWTKTLVTQFSYCVNSGLKKKKFEDRAERIHWGTGCKHRMEREAKCILGIWAWRDMWTVVTLSKWVTTGEKVLLLLFLICFWSRNNNPNFHFRHFQYEIHVRHEKVDFR